MALLLTHLNRPLLPAWNHVPLTTCHLVNFWQSRATLTPRRSLKLFLETIQSDHPDKNVKNPETLTENSNENFVSSLSYTSFKIISRFTGFSRQNEASEMSSKREKGNREKKVKEARWREWERLTRGGKPKVLTKICLPWVSDELRKL